MGFEALRERGNKITVTLAYFLWFLLQSRYKDLETRKAQKVYKAEQTDVRDAAEVARICQAGDQEKNVHTERC